jgi:hypothetical protein
VTCTMKNYSGERRIREVSVFTRSGKIFRRTVDCRTKLAVWYRRRQLPSALCFFSHTGSIERV